MSDVRLTRRYDLADPTGQHEVLDALTGLVLRLDGPAQMRHVRARYVLDGPSRGAAAELCRQLARTATAWRTEIAGLPGDRPAGQLEMPLPEVASELRGRLHLEDGRVGRVLALTGWPATVEPGWLAAFAGHPAVTALVLHLRPIDRATAARLLRRRLASLVSSAGADEQAGRLPDPAVTVAAETAQELWDALARGETALLAAQCLLAVVADDDAGLDDATEGLAHRAAMQLAGLSTLHYEQRPAWAALQPGGQPLRWPWRILDATTVAATIPHPVGPPEIGAGVLAGAEQPSGAPVRADRFGLHNPARLVVGTSGAGKSYAAKLELTRWIAAGAHAVVVDPEGEFDRIGHVLGGLVLGVGDEPAGLDPVGIACSPQLAPAEALAVLASFARALVGTELTAVDLSLLDRALGVLRADRGAEPTVADLVAVLGDLAAHPPYQGADLPARLAPAASGSLAGLFAPNPDLADPPPLVVFDLRAVPGRARPAVMACVLAWAWTRTQVPGVAARRLLVVDEAHLLLDDPSAAELLAQFARRARKYGVGLDVVTQRLSDFLACPAGQAVLANTATKLLLGCEDHERAAVAIGLGLTAAEVERLRPGERGRGLLLTPHEHIPIQVVAHPAEHELATSGPRRRR